MPIVFSQPSDGNQSPSGRKPLKVSKLLSPVNSEDELKSSDVHKRSVTRGLEIVVVSAGDRVWVNVGIGIVAVTGHTVEGVETSMVGD